MGSSRNRHVKNIAFGPPSSASIGRPNDNLGAKGVLRNRVSYSVMIRCIRSTIISVFGHKEDSHKEGTVATDGGLLQRKT